MPIESERTSETPSGDERSPAELLREIRDLKAHVRELNQEAKDFRLERNEARRTVKDHEATIAELQKKSKPSEEVEALRKENRELKHRSAFDGIAREAGVRPGKAADTLFRSIEWGEGDDSLKPESIKARIEAARDEYDFLFAAAPASTATEAPAKGTGSGLADLAGLNPPRRGETPAQKPGPGITRGAPAEGTGRLKLRKSDVQSFDPKVNPFLDRNRSAEFARARAEGRLDFVDE